MKRRDYSIVLEGVDAHDLSLSVLRDLSHLLVEGAQRCARLTAEGRSVARGAPPAWASQVSDVRVAKLEPGSLALAVKAECLRDVAPEIFGELFSSMGSDTDDDATALDLLLDAVDDAAHARRESDRLDAGVLDVLSRTGSSLFTRGGTRLSMSRDGRTTVAIDVHSIGIIKKLADETPTARIARVSGILDTLTMSTKTLALRLDDGRVLRGFAGEASLETLKAHLGGAVVLEGTVTFRPSGTALRMEVESVVAAGEGDVIWAQLPSVESLSLKPRESQSTNGLDAFFGRWPGDETDEELAAALKELS